MWKVLNIQIENYAKIIGIYKMNWTLYDFIHMDRYMRIVTIKTET